jgi:hypothetical protein
MREAHLYFNYNANPEHNTLRRTRISEYSCVLLIVYCGFNLA